jgi:glyoxylase-like metal-dependent hydrolase (beta-lactamase superfamily II)
MVQQGVESVTTTIYSKRLGINYCYLIKSAGCVLFDTGPAFSFLEIIKWIRKIPLDPRRIQLIILSHGHFDHAGAAAKLKECTGAKIAIHINDQKIFEEGSSKLPTPLTAWGKVVGKMMKPAMQFFRFNSSPADILITDDGLSLEEYGIPGKIIHTPGHTAGSISIILDSGEALVGCMTHNAPPFRLVPGHPIFAEDLELLWKSWKILIDQGAEMIYPGHGKPFPIDKIKNKIP